MNDKEYQRHRNKMLLNAFGKICQLCKKRRESRVFLFKINDKSTKLCKECWDKEINNVVEFIR